MLGLNSCKGYVVVLTITNGIMNHIYIYDYILSCNAYVTWVVCKVVMYFHIQTFGFEELYDFFMVVIKYLFLLIIFLFKKHHMCIITHIRVKLLLSSAMHPLCSAKTKEENITSIMK